jgi:hypothetical protein
MDLARKKTMKNVAPSYGDTALKGGLLYIQRCVSKIKIIKFPVGQSCLFQAFYFTTMQSPQEAIATTILTAMSAV